MKIAYLYDFYGEILSEKQQLAVELYYNDDLSLSEIAAQLGISRQGVRDSLKRSEAALLDMENKLGLAARFDSILDRLEVIKRNADEILTLSGGNQNISDRAGKIIDCTKELESIS